MSSGARSLYLKWRSKDFDDVIAQDHVTRTLRNAVNMGQVSHAYLFCGPRGTGKTSTARILAKAVNCISETEDKPCNKCPSCLSISEGQAIDLIEIDAASNRGIDDVRDLREKVRFLPVEAKRKVYIIDEVHMMTPEAFNALLKTLEEPPERTMFVLATTEAHKVPATIVSRCQRFDFRPIPTRSIIGRLQYICGEEGLKIPPATLELIARHAAGGMRDAISLLDQLAVYGKDELTPETANLILGASSMERVDQFIDALVQRDVQAGFRAINDVVNDGADLRQFNREIIEYLRNLMILKVSPGASGDVDLSPETVGRMRTRLDYLSLPDIFSLISIFSRNDMTLKSGNIPQLPLELGIVEFALGRPTASSVDAQAPASVQPKRHANTDQTQLKVVDFRPSTPETPVEAPRSQKAPQVADDHPVAKPSKAPGKPDMTTAAAGQYDPLWQRILEDIRTVNRSVEALLKGCELTSVDDDCLTLAFQYEFHKSKVEEVKNRTLVEKHAGKILGHKCRINCVMAKGDEVSSEVTPQQKREAVQNDERVKAAMNIFNARIVEEK